MQIYAQLTEDEKQTVNGEFFTLKAAIEAYNVRAEATNATLESATEIAFVPLSVGFSFLAALWLFLKRKLWIR